MKEHLYYYNAKVVKVYDGDSIKVIFDLGFGLSFGNEESPTTLRLANINTPEVRGVERPEGIVARDWLREKILNKNVCIKTIRDSKGKYGRYLAIVYLDDININDLLVAEGLAEYKVY